MKKRILLPSLLALSVASAAHAGASFDTPSGVMHLGADVEFDLESSTGTNYEQNGRIRMLWDGTTALENGNYATFKANPGYRMQGDAGALDLDDVWFEFGKKDNWALRVGSWELTSLANEGQDTKIVSVGSTTQYKGQTFRGRLNGGDDFDASQAALTKKMGAVSVEMGMSTLDSADVVVARPVVTYKTDTLTLSVGAELPVVDGGATKDRYEWNGVAFTTSLQVSDAMRVDFHGGMRTGDDALGSSSKMTNDSNIAGTAMQVGGGVQYMNAFVGVLYSADSADDDSTQDANETRIYASYKIPSVMDIDNFAIYLGAGYGVGEKDGVDYDDVAGGKVRFKYTF